MDEVQLGEGAILSPFVTLTSNIRIGRHFHANLYSYVEHDCMIGDYVTFAPCVKCNGNIVIEDHVYIGTGAVIKQGKTWSAAGDRQQSSGRYGGRSDERCPAGCDGCWQSGKTLNQRLNCVEYTLYSLAQLYRRRGGCCPRGNSFQ